MLFFLRVGLGLEKIEKPVSGSDFSKKPEGSVPWFAKLHIDHWRAQGPNELAHTSGRDNVQTQNRQGATY